MAFSRITITFNEDLTDGDTTVFGSNNPFNIFSENCVVTRMNSYEFSQATPTGNAGEATAIAYKAAFILDYGEVLYDITQTLNVVEIVARNEVQVFIGGSSNADVLFNIDSVNDLPFEETTRINVRSPYFIFAPIDTGSQIITPSNVTFELYIWSGDKTTDKPIDPNYTYQKTSRFLNDNIIYIDVSKQIQDFIEHSYSGTLVNNVVFASWDITSVYSGGSIVSNDTVIAFDGYNDYFDNINYIPSSDMLISNRYISVKKEEDLNIPFYTGKHSYSLESRNGTTIVDTDTFSALNISNTNEAVFLITLDSNEVNNIRIVNDDTLEETIIEVEEVEECVYNTVKCVFINKQGVLQEFWFFKASKEDVRVTNETYKRNVLNESIVSGKATLNYSTSSHLNQRYNTQGNKNITLNTGYIDEDNNTLIEELLMSENIWLNIGGVINAVDITDKSVSYLTKRNDQLIKYTLKFAYSYDVRQNIR